MSHAHTNKSQATNRPSCHVSRRQQQQIVLLAISHADTSKSQATNRTSCHVSRRYQQITGNNRTSCHVSCRNQQITGFHADTSKAGNKSNFLPCLTQIAAKSQATNRTSCHAYFRQQIIGNESCILPCLTQIPANHRQQIVLLAMSHADTSKSKATNRISCHFSRTYQEIPGNNSYFLPCLTQTAANHRQQIVLLAISHADTSKSQATNRTSCHVSRRYQQITGNKAFFLPCLTQVPANHKQ